MPSVTWTTGRASGFLKTECWWYVGGGALTGALDMLKSSTTATPSSVAAAESRNGLIFWD